MTTDADAPPPPAPKPDRWKLAIVIPGIIAVVVASNVAAATWATLVRNHPVWLIALSPVNRYLLLTANELDAVTYFGVGMVRHMIPDPLFWLIGAWYGDRALAWIVQTYPGLKSLLGQDGQALSDAQSRKILYPLALVVPNNWVSLVCGAARIPFPTFAALNVVGTAARLLLVRWIASLFSGEIRDVVDLVARYQLPATLASMALVGVSIAFQFRRGSGEIVGIMHIGDDLTD